MVLLDVHFTGDGLIEVHLSLKILFCFGKFKLSKGA